MAKTELLQQIRKVLEIFSEYWEYDRLMIYLSKLTSHIVLFIVFTINKAEYVVQS